MDNNQTQAITPTNNAVCKYCGSTHTKKYGFYKGIQRYYCHDCHRKFSVNDQLFKMKTSTNQVSSALDEYYKGMSVNDIRDYLNEQYHNLPSSHTIYEWIDKYTHEAENRFKNYHPQVGSEWIADETVLKIQGKNYWCIDIIDKDTRFLLATKLSSNRSTEDIRELMEHARDVAGTTPKEVLTDGWKGYIDGIELAFGADTKHIVTDPFDSEHIGENSELIERWHSTLKERTKVMRGLKSIGNARKF